MADLGAVGAGCSVVGVTTAGTHTPVAAASAYSQTMGAAASSFAETVRVLGNIFLGLMGAHTKPITLTPQSTSMPSSLPAPTYDGYSLEPEDRVARTSMDVGAPRARLRSSARYDKISVTWKFKPAEMETFRTWFEAYAGGGAAWFYLDVADGTTAGQLLRTREVRFAGMWKSSLQPGNTWVVSATVEVR